MLCRKKKKFKPSNLSKLSLGPDRSATDEPELCKKVNKKITMKIKTI